MPELPDRDLTVPPPIPSPNEFALTRTYALPASPGTDVPSSDLETQVQLTNIALAIGATPAAPASGIGVAPIAGRYAIVREIGRGGMGIVLEAEDQQLGRRLALKVLQEQHADDPVLVRRFLDEARICARMQHPGIVPVLELGWLSDQRPFFTMKLIQGKTLAALLRARRGPADDLPRFLTIFEQVCQTMAYAHAHDVIHRDLKPSNIMVGSFGDVQVMDWGLAKVLAEGARGEGRGARNKSPSSFAPFSPTDLATSLVGMVMGTPGYMSPEQARGEVNQIDARCDVFGLGAILCVILTGKSPYEGLTHPEAYRQAVEGDLDGAHARLSACSVDAELVRLARQCLADEAGERPCDASIVALAVTNYRASVAERLQASELAQASAQVKIAAERKARRLTVALAAAVIALLLLGGGGWFWREHERIERRNHMARVVELHIQRALRLREQGQSGEVSSLAALTEALDAARAAENTLAGGDADPALRQRVEALRATLQREERDAYRQLWERVGELVDTVGLTEG